MLRSTVLDLPQEEQAQLLAARRRARYGYLLALRILLQCAAGRHPTDIAAVLFCSRSSVYRKVRAYQEGTLGLQHDAQGWLAPPLWTTVLTTALQRSLLALLKAVPHAYGWYRTRWSCATLPLTLQTKRGITVSAATMRRWRHNVGWMQKRAKLVARDDDPQRVERLVRIRLALRELLKTEKRKEILKLRGQLQWEGDLIDCLIVALCIEEDVELFHKDADFDAIARVAPLRVYGRPEDRDHHGQHWLASIMGVRSCMISLPRQRCSHGSSASPRLPRSHVPWHQPRHRAAAPRCG